jgi:hypothetical protein
MRYAVFGRENASCVMRHTALGWLGFGGFFQWLEGRLLFGRLVEVLGSFCLWLAVWEGRI